MLIKQLIPLVALTATVSAHQPHSEDRPASAIVESSSKVITKSHIRMVASSFSEHDPATVFARASAPTKKADTFSFTTISGHVWGIGVINGKTITNTDPPPTSLIHHERTSTKHKRAPAPTNQAVSFSIFTSSGHPWGVGLWDGKTVTVPINTAPPPTSLLHHKHTSKDKRAAATTIA